MHLAVPAKRTSDKSVAAYRVVLNLQFPQIDLSTLYFNFNKYLWKTEQSCNETVNRQVAVREKTWLLHTFLSWTTYMETHIVVFLISRHPEFWYVFSLFFNSLLILLMVASFTKNISSKVVSNHTLYRVIYIRFLFSGTRVRLSSFFSYLCLEYSSIITFQTPLISQYMSITDHILLHRITGHSMHNI